jgi:hypothetical protein
MIYKPLHRIIKIEQHESDFKPGCSVRVSSSCSTCGICHVTLATNPLTSHEWKKTGLWFRQTEHIRSHLWHRYSVTVNKVMDIYYVICFIWLKSVISANVGWENIFRLKCK